MHELLMPNRKKPRLFPVTYQNYKCYVNAHRAAKAFADIIQYCKKPDTQWVFGPFEG